MHIWIDGQCFQTSSAARGIGRYVADLLIAVSKTGKARLTISLNANMLDSAISARSWLRSILPEAEIRVWHGLTRTGEIHGGYSDIRALDAKMLAQHITEIAPEVALSTSPFEGEESLAAPLLDLEGITALTACIFYDAIPYRYPAAYLSSPSQRRSYLRKLTEIPKFDVVLGISEFSTQEYSDIFGKTNAFTIGAGISEELLALLAEPAPLQPPSTAQQSDAYVLYVGGGDWRKNLPFLLEAMAEIEACLAGELRLVIAGSMADPVVATLRQIWAENALPDEGLVFTGWISDADLIGLYRGAQATVQPSLMEGFGLTVLEAMAAGSPILASRQGALAEVVGNPDLLFDPHDRAEFAAKLTRLLCDPEFRRTSIAFGRKRAEGFSWKNSAETMLEGLAGALAAHRRGPLLPPAAAPPPQPRLVMDCSETLVSRASSGIQRVMHRLAAIFEAETRRGASKTAFTFCHPERGVFELPRLDKRALVLHPGAGHVPQVGDTLLLLDSTWVLAPTNYQQARAALAIGQDVVHGVYDLGPLTMPALTSLGMPPVFRNWLDFVLSHGTGVLCISRAVADEVYELVGALQLPRPLNIGYFRLGADFSEAQADAQWLGFLGGRPTFLMVGTIEPRKGHRIALEAFDALWQSGIDVNLLIIGKPGWNVRLLLHQLQAHPEFENRLFLRTQVSDGALRAAYQAAAALIMTSYLEGFGLPIAEAGSLGCPVIASDLPVFREVGDAAPEVQFFPPENATALARLIAQSLERPLRRGLPHAGRWPSWAESAAEVREVVFGDSWYRRYTPASLSPRTELSEIGNTKMTRPLEREERRHRIRRVEGPLLSDEEDVLWFVVGLRNDGPAIWSSEGENDGSFALNLGCHIYDAQGICIAYEQSRTRIPFVLLPGQEILLPVRVSLDWLRKGGRYIGLEMVQEGVSWMGERLRLDILQHSGRPDTVEDPDELRKLRFKLVHRRLHGGEAQLVLAGFNASRDSIAFPARRDDLSLHLQDGAGRTLGKLPLDAVFDRIGPSGHGLLATRAKTAELSRAKRFELTVECRGEVLRWTIPIEGDPNTPLKSKTLSDSRMPLEIDALAELNNRDFVAAIYQRILGRRVDQDGLDFYKWALDLKRLTRTAAAQRVASDNDLADQWDIHATLHPEPGRILVKYAPGSSAAQILERLENRLGQSLPAATRESWLAGKASIADLCTTVGAFWGGFHSELDLIEDTPEPAEPGAKSPSRPEAKPKVKTAVE